MHKAHPSMSALCHKQTFAALTHSLFCRDLVAELKVADCRDSPANWKAPRRHVGDVMRMTIAAVFAATFTISVSAQEYMAGSGTPAVAFPNPDRPVADIVSPIWRGEKERDDAGEAQQLVRLLGIKSGMTVADIGAGSGYYVVRLSPMSVPTAAS